MRRRSKTCSASGQEAPGSERLGEHPMTSQVLLSRQWRSYQRKRWDLNEPRDQRDVLGWIREKRPKLVSGSCPCAAGDRGGGGDHLLGMRRRKCIMFRTILHHEQLRRGAWFLHDVLNGAWCRQRQVGRRTSKLPYEQSQSRGRIQASRVWIPRSAKVSANK